MYILIFLLTTIFGILLHHYFINAHAFIKTFKQLIFDNLINLTRQIVYSHDYSACLELRKF